MTPIAVLLAVLAPVPNAPPERDDSGERPIVITGDVWQRRMSETASSVSVTGGEEGERAGTDRLEELLVLIPNVTAGSGGMGPAIRGQDATGSVRNLAAFLGGVRPRIAVQVDGREAGYNEMIFGTIPLWDVEQIEIFRTPQALTGGRDSSAGSIHVSTVEPGFDWDGRARGAVGSFDQRTLSGALSVPLARGQLALRIAGDGHWGETTSRIVKNARGADPDVDRHALVRVRLRAEPSALPGLRFDASYARTTSQMPQIAGIRGPDYRKREDPRDGYGIFGTRFDGLTANFAWQVDQRWRATILGTTTLGRVQRYASPGLGETLTYSTDRTAEVRVERRGDRVRLLLGAHGGWLDQDQRIDLSALSTIGNYREDRTSGGLFGQVAVDVVDAVTLEAGLRRQRDVHRRTGSLEDLPLLDVDLDRETVYWLPRLSITARVSDAVNLGVLAVRGYSPAGETVVTRIGFPTDYAAESSWTIEAFARARFDHGRGRLEANLFHSDLRDQQRDRPMPVAIPGVPPFQLSEVVNLPKVRTRGAELSASWHAAPLRLDLGLGLLDTRIVEGIEDYGLSAGNDLERAPLLSGAAAATLEPGHGWLLRVGARGDTGYYSDDGNDEERRVKGSLLFDARVEKAVSRVRLSLSVRNMFDTFAFRYKLPQLLAAAHDPREIMLGIETGF